MSGNYNGRYEKLEDKYRLISDNLIEAIFVLDAETLEFDYINPHIEKISGYTAGEYRNLTIKDRLLPDSYQNTLGLIDKAKESYKQGVHEIQTVEVELLHKDRSTYWAEIRAKISADMNRPLKIIGIIKEISARKRIEQKQVELIKSLGDALAEKERLLKENELLMGLLPICSGCKRIRDGNGRWWPLEAYITKHTDANITHTFCTDCSEIYMNL
jgi:PAS domain S-box-containing protein